LKVVDCAVRFVRNTQTACDVDHRPQLDMSSCRGDHRPNSEHQRQCLP
jgi:hypothetical protein